MTRHRPSPPRWTSLPIPLPEWRPATAHERTALAGSALARAYEGAHMKYTTDNPIRLTDLTPTGG